MRVYPGVTQRSEVIVILRLRSAAPLECLPGLPGGLVANVGSPLERPHCVANGLNSEGIRTVVEVVDAGMPARLPRSGDDWSTRDTIHSRGSRGIPTSSSTR